MTNPYTPPSVESLDDPLDADNYAEIRSFAIRMSGLVLANCVVPTFFALAVTSISARIGMGIAVVIIAVLCILLGIGFPHFRLVLPRGATALCLLQLLPIGHIFAGLFAITVCGQLGLATIGDDNNPVGYIASMTGGLVCTLIVASMSLCIVIPLGLLLSNKSNPPATD